MSWLDIDVDSPFSLANLPFGIVSEGASPRPAVAVGSYILDLHEFTIDGGFKRFEGDLESAFVGQTTLNAFAALGRQVHRSVRAYLREVLTANGPYAEVLEKNEALRQKVVKPASSVQNHLPMAIGDYTDFYVGVNHAFNCGVLFRGPENALNPNYHHLPVGYHGRASSVVVSGTPIHRPMGQILTNPTSDPKLPLFAPTAKFDFELELAAFIARPNPLGSRVSIDDADEHIFGYVLMNDWSARDVQAWEYVPLGPFTGKNFGTLVSPWIVLADALEPFKTLPLPRPAGLAPLLSYLDENNRPSVFDINLEIEIQTHDGQKATISHGTAKNMQYSFPQMIAHHTVTGCNLQTGDLLGSGTISGTTANSLGSLLEMTSGGKTPIEIGSARRTFLLDSDTVVFRAVAGAGPDQVGFGPLIGTVLPCLPDKS